MVQSFTLLWLLHSKMQLEKECISALVILHVQDMDQSGVTTPAQHFVMG